MHSIFHAFLLLIHLKSLFRNTKRNSFQLILINTTSEETMASFTRSIRSSSDDLSSFLRRSSFTLPIYYVPAIKPAFFRYYIKRETWRPEIYIYNYWNSLIFQNYKTKKNSILFFTSNIKLLKLEFQYLRNNYKSIYRF